MELLGSGVSVTAVCPGPVATEFGDVAQRGGGGEQLGSPEFFKVPSEEVVRVALSAAFRNRPRVFPGLLVAAAVLCASALPLVILRPLLSRR